MSAQSPVRARPPSAWYRIGKFTRRHRLAVGSLSTLFVAVIVFGSGMAWMAREAARERDRANQEAEISRRVTAFTAGLFELANPASGAGNVSAHELLDAGMRRLDVQYANDPPEVRAALYEAAGNAYRGLGDYDDAERVLQEAHALREPSFERDPQALAQVLIAQGLLRREQGRFEEAEARLREGVAALEKNTAVAPDTMHRARLELAELLRRRSRLDEAAELADTTRSALEKAGGARGHLYARSLYLLGRSRAAQGRLPEAEQLLRRALDVEQAAGSVITDSMLEARNGLADVLVVQGKSAEAEAPLRQIVADATRLYGESHPDVGVTYTNLGNALSDLPEKFGEAEQAYLHALDIVTRTEDWARAESSYAKAAALRAAPLGPQHPDTAGARVGRALALNRLGRFREAEEVLREGIAAFTAALGASHWRTANARTSLGAVLTNQRRFDEAERELNDARRLLVAALGAEHCRVGNADKALRELADARAAAR